VLKEQSNNFCMPHDVLAYDDVLIRFVLSCTWCLCFAARGHSVGSHTALRCFVSEDLDGQLRTASSPTLCFRVSIRIFLILLTKTLNSRKDGDGAWILDFL